MSNPIKTLTEIATSFGPKTAQLASIVLDDPRFAKWSGSGNPKGHHYGEGMLAQHTLEVVELSLANNQYFYKFKKSADPEYLFLAALYHDVGKMWDYSPLPPIELPADAGIFAEGRGAYQEWEYSLHRKYIHHIPRSAIEWSKAFDKYGLYLPSGAHDEILHGILSHHGRLEWHSPVEPQNALGWVLHLSDMLSAQMYTAGNTKK